MEANQFNQDDQKHRLFVAFMFFIVLRKKNRTQYSNLWFQRQVKAREIFGQHASQQG
jgi:hypothetical protein